MTQNIVNVGQTPNDRSADSIRTAFQKINANFTELYGNIADIEIGAVNWEAVSGKPNFALVATSGSYTDLFNKPTIVTDISQLTDNQGLLADSFDGGGAASEYNEEQTIDGGGA